MAECHAIGRGSGCQYHPGPLSNNRPEALFLDETLTALENTIHAASVGLALQAIYLIQGSRTKHGWDDQVNPSMPAMRQDKRAKGGVCQ